jgi:SAM-dependent methyltransferase
VGAGCCWASARLLAAGHRAAALDVNLDRDDGLFAASRMVEPERLPRAEADMEAVPLEPASVDLVLAAGSLHYARRPDRVLVELRRVTRRGGVLVVIDSPVYRHLEDGEAMVSERMERQSARYRVDFGRESQSGYFLVDELPALFQTSGWSLEVHGWPGRAREIAGDAADRLRWSRRTARYPVLVGRRHE